VSATVVPRALGQHWILDAEGCAAPGLGERARFEAALSAVPAALGLTAVAPPQLFEAPAPGGGAEALMGLVLLSESHFSLHLLLGTRRLYADLFSCRPFEPEAARALLEEAFAFERAEERLFWRGPEGSR
jgi:S-adenosylmethionine decarboxylase